MAGALILFGITFVGIFISCKVFDYKISTLRKMGAALVFVALNSVHIPIPIPFVAFFIAPLGLYMALMDNTYQRTQVNKVFGLTFAIAVFAILIVYLPQIM